MSVKDRMALILLLPVITWSTNGRACPAATQESKSTPPSLEEIRSKRATVRENLMIPSLDGIRGFAYGVVGSANPELLEKKMGAKLEQLRLPMFTFGQLKDGVEPVDAMVQLSFLRLGKYAIGELTVTQWVALSRSPKTKVRAVTYRNRLFVPASNAEQAVTELADQFVIDTLKANRKETETASRRGAAPAKDSAPGAREAEN